MAAGAWMTRRPLATAGNGYNFRFPPAPRKPVSHERNGFSYFCGYQCARKTSNLRINVRKESAAVVAALGCFATGPRRSAVRDPPREPPGALIFCFFSIIDDRPHPTARKPSSDPRDGQGPRCNDYGVIVPEPGGEMGGGMGAIGPGPTPGTPGVSGVWVTRVESGGTLP